MKILEMALSKKEILNDLRAHSKTFIMHMIMLTIFNSKLTVNHWKKEIYSFYSSVPKCKNTNKYPTVEEIYSSIFGHIEDDFEYMFDSYIDVINVKEDVFIDPDIFSQEKILKIKNFIRNYTLWISKKLSENGKVFSVDVFTKLNELLNS